MGLSLGKRWGRSHLIVSALYGQGLLENERDVEAKVAALFQVHGRVTVGFDLRARFDVGTQSDEGEAAAGDAAGPERHLFDLVAVRWPQFRWGPSPS